MSPPPTIDLEGLGFDDGRPPPGRAGAGRAAGRRPPARDRAPTRRSASTCAPGAAPAATGRAARRRRPIDGGAVVVRGARRPSDGRAPTARAARPAGRRRRRPSDRWGLAARGALVEAGGPPLRLRPGRPRRGLGRPRPAALRPGRGRSQWDPATAIDWDAPSDLPADIEAAVVQVMTYLVENEQAALIVPARFLGRIHPHFREVVQLLAVQVADEARHVEVFTRRAAAARRTAGRVGRRRAGVAADAARRARLRPGLVPAVGARRGHASSPARLPRAPRARPGHPPSRPPRRSRTRPATSPSAWPTSSTRCASDPSLREPAAGGHRAPPRRPGRHRRPERGGLRRAGRPGRRARGTPTAIAPRATDAVQRLQAEMDEGRQRRLVRLGFPPDEAAALSALHTRNFM